ncbi:MAG: hypothetical protein WCA15_06015 [Candidatus Acidiferrales bacterium]
MVVSPSKRFNFRIFFLDGGLHFFCFLLTFNIKFPGRSRQVIQHIQDEQSDVDVDSYSYLLPVWG